MKYIHMIVQPSPPLAIRTSPHTEAPSPSSTGSPPPASGATTSSLSLGICLFWKLPVNGIIQCMVFGNQLYSFRTTFSSFFHATTCISIYHKTSVLWLKNIPWYCKMDIHILFIYQLMTIMGCLLSCISVYFLNLHVIIRITVLYLTYIIWFAGGKHNFCLRKCF